MLTDPWEGGTASDEIVFNKRSRLKAVVRFIKGPTFMKPITILDLSFGLDTFLIL